KQPRPLHGRGEARMAMVERGCLAIGDITGPVASRQAGGDAVFCYDREDEAAGPMLLTMTESCYSPRPTTMSERSPGTCGTTNHCVHGEYAGTIGCIDARACGPPSGSSRIVARVRRPPSMGVSSDVNVESSGD